MKVLIVDDLPQKYKALLTAIEKIALFNPSIEIVQNANEARDRLEAETYSLLLIDINLPLNSVDKPSFQPSIELIQEIVETDNFNKPKHILGITADVDAAIHASPIFSQQLWTLIRYSETNDEWLSQILNCITYIHETISLPSQKEPLNESVDVAIICALRDPELLEVLRLPWGFQAPRPIDNVQFVHDGKFTSADKTFTVAATFSPRMGMVSTAITTSRIIERLKPKIVVMVGICAGIKGKANLGDVIFADPVWDWQSGKYIQDTDGNLDFSISPHQIGAPSEIRSHVEQLKNMKEELIKIALAGPRNDSGPLKIVVGPVASGSAVIANDDIVADIKANQHRDVCAIEMECYGLYAAVDLTSLRPKPCVFALKSVCDFADPYKKDGWQQYASYTSANILKLLLETYGHRFIV